MKQKMTRWQKVGFCTASLLPALWLLLGLFIWILGGSVLTLSFILAHLLLPAATLLLLWLTIRSNKNAAWKWVLSIVILCLSILLAIMLMGAGHFSIYDHAKGQDEGEGEYRPAQDHEQTQKQPDGWEQCGGTEADPLPPGHFLFHHFSL